MKVEARSWNKRHRSKLWGMAIYEESYISSASSMSNGSSRGRILCECGFESPFLTSWTKENPRRRFWGCGKFKLCQWFLGFVDMNLAILINPLYYSCRWANLWEEGLQFLPLVWWGRQWAWEKDYHKSGKKNWRVEEESRQWAWEEDYHKSEKKIEEPNKKEMLLD